MVSVEVLGGGQVVLLAVVFTSIVRVQPVSQLRGERPAGGAGGLNGRGGGRFKGLSPVSNSSQRDRTTLSSLFNLRLKRATFVSLVFHCSCVCGGTTSGTASKYWSPFR